MKAGCCSSECQLVGGVVTGKYHQSYSVPHPLYNCPTPFHTKPSSDLPTHPSIGLQIRLNVSAVFLFRVTPARHYRTGGDLVRVSELLVTQVYYQSGPNPKNLLALEASSHWFSVSVDPTRVIVNKLKLKLGTL